MTRSTLPAGILHMISRQLPYMMWQPSGTIAVCFMAFGFFFSGPLNGSIVVRIPQPHRRKTEAHQRTR